MKKIIRDIKVILLVALVTFILTIAIIYIILVSNGLIDTYDNKRAEQYIEKMKTALEEKQEVEIREIFEFDFDRAYVFKDTYVDGKGFSSFYNLDISIDQVDKTYSEEVRRIVFVDEKGDFVYEFRYRMGKLYIKEEGMIIYPYTKFKKWESSIEGSQGIEFIDVKDEDYY